MKNGKKKTDKDQFVEDYVKVATAGFGLPPQQEDQAIETAIKGIWERRRREKAARQRGEAGKK